MGGGLGDPGQGRLHDRRCAPLAEAAPVGGAELDELPGPVPRVGRVVERSPGPRVDARLAEPGQVPLAVEQADGRDPLPCLRHHRERGEGGLPGDPRVAARVVGVEPDHVRDQPRDPGPRLVVEQVVDPAGHRRQQRMGARGMVGPALPGEVGRELHEAGTLARVAVLAPREDGHVVRCPGHRVAPERKGRARRSRATSLPSLRRDPVRHHPHNGGSDEIRWEA